LRKVKKTNCFYKSFKISETRKRSQCQDFSTRSVEHNSPGIVSSDPANHPRSKFKKFRNEEFEATVVQRVSKINTLDTGEKSLNQKISDFKN
jgi:hypothetical protein